MIVYGIFKNGKQIGFNLNSLHSATLMFNSIKEAIQTNHTIINENDNNDYFVVEDLNDNYAILQYDLKLE